MRRLATLLLHAGSVATVLGLSKVHAVAADYDFTSSSRAVWAMAFVGLLGLSAYATGLPELRSSRRDAWLGALVVVGASLLALSVVQLLAGAPLLPRFVMLGSIGVLVPWYVLTARLAGDHQRGTDSRTRMALVARPSDQDVLVDELADASHRVDVVARLTPAEASTSAGEAPLLTAARAARANLVVLCRDAQADESVVAQAALLHETGVRVRTLALFYEERLGKVQMSELERMSLMFDIGDIHRVRYGRAKRALDVAFALAGTALLAVVVPVVAVLNVAGGNRGPLFFRQERVGRGGQRFVMLKLRTMRDDAPGGGEAGRWTSEDDPRITPFGRLLRESHLDELPQVVNILRGDLSVVGPRPEQPRYVEELATKLPFYDLRHIVRPGLTGWAQVRYGYAGNERDALQKLQYDFHYLRHQDLWFDLRVMGRTLRSVVGSEGRGR